MITILLVDDDIDVRKLCRIALERAGHAILEAGSGCEAQRVWEQNTKNVDLLLTDYQMPGITGLELSNILTHRKQDLMVILMSGMCPEHIGVPQDMQFLQKPFSREALIDSVHQCHEGRLNAKSVCASV